MCIYAAAAAAICQKRLLCKLDCVVDVASIGLQSIHPGYFSEEVLLDP